MRAEPIAATYRRVFFGTQIQYLFAAGTFRQHAVVQVPRHPGRYPKLSSLTLSYSAKSWGHPSFWRSAGDVLYFDEN